MTRTCKKCGIDFECGSSGSKVHCSSCKRPYARDISFSDIKSPSNRRSRLIKDRGVRCEDCGLTEWKGHPIPITVHHVDGNSDNNTEENLRLLCPNCHALTPNFSGKNRGKTTSKRSVYMKKYREFDSP